MPGSSSRMPYAPQGVKGLDDDDDDQFTNAGSELLSCLVIFYVPHPYHMTNLTFVLKIQILVLSKIFLFLHTGYNFTKFPFIS